MNLPNSSDLDIQALSRLFNTTSESYKYFWFRAVVEKILQGQTCFSYESLIDEMIADAWYMVAEYHLNLGPSDTLEKTVDRLAEISGLKSSEKKEVILNYLSQCTDSVINKNRQVLSLNVPYRLQAPFMPSMKGKEWSRSTKMLSERINRESGLIYYFQEYNGLKTNIQIQSEWADYIQRNQEIVKGWIELKLVTYLQRRNPSVPGIIDKLYPPTQRKLDQVKKYWKMVIDVQPIIDIYSDEPLEVKDISIDHFIPWSYVAHDELWNLLPTTKSINSSKSNHLADWDIYFPKLVEMEFEAYLLNLRYEKIAEEFRRCAREHLNNDDIRARLYKKDQNEQQFKAQLEEIMFPVYQSAKNAGFDEWNRYE